MKKIKKKRIAALLGLAYLLISGVLVFIRPKKVSDEYMKKSSLDRFQADSEGPDRVIILDQPDLSGMARLKLIKDAQETLNISYFSIETGESPDLFFAALLEAADRGVQVNILLDGIFHGIKKDLKPILYASKLHPNMTIKFYEPLNPLLPWTLNNRMHDKYIIADSKYAMIGGRNIGDKYFDPVWYEDRVTLDRDVLIVSTREDSVIEEMEAYFKEIWNHKFSKESKRNVFLIRKKRAFAKYLEVREKLELLREHNQELLELELDLEEISLPTEKITFIHNPLERFSKEPWVWYELSQLIKSAENKIFFQSPYTIPTKGMIKNFFTPDDLEGVEVTLLTNSMASSPNYPAFAGYLNHREEMVDAGIKIYEYQSLNSLHTKAFVIDDDYMALGSFNGDPRSTYLSTESMVVIKGEEAVRALSQGLEDYMKSSLQVAEDYSYKGGQAGALEAPKEKRALLKALSWLVRYFEYLL